MCLWVRLPLLSETEIQSLLEITVEKLREQKNQLTIASKETWDSRVRNRFFRIMTDEFRKKYGNEREAKGYIYVEGCNRLPFEEIRHSLFGSRLYPDALLRCGSDNYIAIELDYATDEKKSKIKNALSKAGLVYLVGKPKIGKVVLLMFYYGSKLPDMSDDLEIRKFYAEKLKTKVEFVYLPEK
jgi:hypothetical protein